MKSTFIDLNELVRILQSFGSKTAKSLFHPRKKSSTIHRLARKFAQDYQVAEDQNERAWAEEIFGERETSETYLWHRANLRRQLLDRLMLLDVRAGSERRKMTYRSHKALFLARVLLIFGAQKTAISLLPTALKRARKYEFTENRIEFLHMLANNAALNGYRNEFALYAKELREAQELRAAELELELLRGAIDVESVGHAEPTQKAKQLARQLPRQSRALFHQFPTFHIGLSHFRIAVSSSEITEDLEEGFSEIQKANVFLSKFPLLYLSAIRGEFELHRVWLSLANAAYSDAANAVVAYRHLIAEGSNNWFIAEEYAFFLSMHTERYSEALDLCRQRMSHKRFSSQTDQVRQKWKLFRLYSSLASAQFAMEKSAGRAFSRVLKEVPMYKKDKAGYNASLIALQCLILASRGNLNGFSRKCDTIRKYIDRSMRKKHHKPLYGFFKTLLLFDAYDFDVETTERHAAKYIVQMKRYGVERITESQTMRYDTMWGWISRKLEAAKIAKRSSSHVSILSKKLPNRRRKISGSVRGREKKIFLIDTRFVVTSQRKGAIFA